ncbi:MAG: hypothetical protein NT098_01250 [Candidatus Parcubacteria bacterium]|nr:hypothetical protein [Candidatus Parcubacteria bacterium]
MQEQKIKNKISFITSLFFAALFFPSVSLAAIANVSAYAVSPSDIWSDGVILKGTTGTTPPSSNYYRWFEFSLTGDGAYLNSTPRQTISSNPVYSEKITGLFTNRTYAYRAVIEVNNQRYYGTNLLFKTKGPGYSAPDTSSGLAGYTYNGNVTSGLNQGYQYTYTNPTVVSGSSGSGSGSSAVTYSTVSYVVSKQADSITGTSGRMNAMVYPTTNYSVYGWYECGLTPDLGQMTTRVFIGTGQSLYFGQVLTGLAPGTAYFFRPVAENRDGSRMVGTTLVFVTSGTPVVQPVVTPTQPVTPVTNVTPTTPVSSGTVKTPVKTPTVPVTPENQKTITIKDLSTRSTIAPGERVTKNIILENTTGKDLIDVSARIILPEGLTPVSDKHSICKPFGQVLFCDIGNMTPNQKTEISYTVDVSKDVKDKDSLETIVIVTGKYKTGGNIDNLQRIRALVDASGGNNKEGISCVVPSNAKDWLLAALFILLLVTSYFSWKYFTEKEEGKGKEENYGNKEITAYLKEQEHSAPKVVMHAPVNEKGAPPTNLPI